VHGDRKLVAEWNEGGHSTRGKVPCAGQRAKSRALGFLFGRGEPFPYIVITSEGSLFRTGWDFAKRAQPRNWGRRRNYSFAKSGLEFLRMRAECYNLVGVLNTKDSKKNGSTRKPKIRGSLEAEKLDWLLFLRGGTSERLRSDWKIKIKALQTRRKERPTQGGTNRGWSSFLGSSLLQIQRGPYMRKTVHQGLRRCDMGGGGH